ncbi:MAG TPA: TIGR01777 family oxidoreductase [Gemmatimonadales bacterium]|jgi:hypothetical protein
MLERRIVITGATGMVGTALSTALAADGWTIVPITRHPVPGGIAWAAGDGPLDPAALTGATAVINLAGENLAGGRWTDARKRRLRDSRIDTTTKLVEAITRADPPPPVLISVSAVGYYGDRGDELLDESSPPGEDFLARLCVDWEAACRPARYAGVRVVHPRFGMILSPHGGALDRMLPVFRLGLGGRFGNGQQWLSWITIADVVAAIRLMLATTAIEGPVNVTAPEAVRNLQFAHLLGDALHRPAVLPAPAVALRVALGEMADAALLGSQRVVPRVLQEHGFRWQDPTLRDALSRMVGRPAAEPAEPVATGS